MNLQKHQIELIVIITLTVIIVAASIIRSPTSDVDSHTAKLEKEITSLQEQRARCQKSEIQTQETIKRLLVQLKQLDPTLASDKQKIEEHNAQIRATQSELSECLKLIEENENRVKILEEEIKAMQEKASLKKTSNTTVID